MAKIVKSSVQLEALKEVNDRIKLVQKIEELLKDDSDLSVKRGKLKITLTDKNIIKKVLLSLKRDTLHQINKKCTKYSIELDEKERKMLDREFLEMEEKNETENLVDKTEDLIESEEKIENLVNKTETENESNLVKENDESENLEIKSLDDDDLESRLDYVYDLENDEIIK